MVCGSSGEVKSLQRPIAVPHRDMKSKAIVPTLFFVFAATFGTGCVNTPRSRTISQEDRPIKTRTRLWVLSAENRSSPASLEGAAGIQGFDEGDLKSIAGLIGRIEGISHQVFRLEKCFEDFIVAVKVYVPERIIYCTRNADAEWEVVTIARVSAGGQR